MIRRILPLTMFLLVNVLWGCGSSGVGDPCTIPNPTSGTACPYVEVGSCFSGAEIYIETQALQCRSRVCMVYQWDQNALLGMQMSDHEFCTCKCGGPGDPSTFCNCSEPRLRLPGRVRRRQPRHPGDLIACALRSYRTRAQTSSHRAWRKHFDGRRPRQA